MENLGLPAEIIANISSFKPRDRDMGTPHGKIMGDLFKGLEMGLVNALFDVSSRYSVEIEKPEEDCFRLTLDLWSDKFYD